MILYLDNEVDKATIQSDQASVNLPVSNIKDQRLSRIFRGEEYTEVNINGFGSLKNISKTYTNLIQDPTDLTTGNWTLMNGATAIASSEEYQGLPMTKLGSTTAIVNSRIQQSQTITNAVFCANSIVLRNGNHTNSSDDETIVSGLTSSVVFLATITWVDKIVVISNGTAKYFWADDDTVIITGISDSTDSTSYAFRIDPINVSDTTKFIYATSCQLVNNTETFFPFFDGAKPTDSIDVDFTMPDNFTFDMIVKPSFQYDTTLLRYMFNWTDPSSNKMILIYNVSVDKFELAWDDPNYRTLRSQQFDDGLSFTDLYQRIRITGSMSLTSGDINASRAIFTPLGSGSIFEDSTWSLTPDVKTSEYDTLEIGHNNGSNQSDSEFEYFRIYEGLLIGTITDSDDITELLKDKKLLLDKTYQQRMTATDILIANSTINDGDTILLSGNNVDSFGPGTPVDEVITWSKNIIKHNFLKSSNQFWRLSVNSSNIIDIGRIYLGVRYTSPGMEALVPHSRATTTRKTISYGGQTYGDKGHFASLIQLRFPKIIRDEYNELVQIWETTDIDIAFFVTFNKGGNILETKYVTFDQEELKLIPLGNRDLYNTSLKFIEEVK